MFKGVYDLTSGMLSQTRNLDVIANNISNVSTSGYKTETYLDSTFRELMFSRVGNRDKTDANEIGTQTMALLPSAVETDYTQGVLEETGQILDFAINGNGFFQVQGQDGNVLTRNGSFILDEEGYLAAPSQGRVLGTNAFTADASGNLFLENGTLAGRIGVFDVPGGDYQQALQKQGEGTYVANGQVQAVNTPIQWKYVENANVDAVREMTRMMSSQRALQSASQILKIYNQLMGKAVSDVGRV